MYTYSANLKGKMINRCFFNEFNSLSEFPIINNILLFDIYTNKANLFITKIKFILKKLPFSLNQAKQMINKLNFNYIY